MRMNVRAPEGVSCNPCGPGFVSPIAMSWDLAIVVIPALILYIFFQ